MFDFVSDLAFLGCIPQDVSASGASWKLSKIHKNDCISPSNTYTVS